MGTKCDEWFHRGLRSRFYLVRTSDARELQDNDPPRAATDADWRAWMGVESQNVGSRDRAMNTCGKRLMAFG
jgi:hypothetical protein